jgi:hypothetical protein
MSPTLQVAAEQRCDTLSGVARDVHRDDAAGAADDLASQDVVDVAGPCLAVGLPGRVDIRAAEQRPSQRMGDPVAGVLAGRRARSPPYWTARPSSTPTFSGSATSQSGSTRSESAGCRGVSPRTHRALYRAGRSQPRRDRNLLLRRSTPCHDRRWSPTGGAIQDEARVWERRAAGRLSSVAVCGSRLRGKPGDRP